MGDRSVGLRCSFCGKEEAAVAKIIAGPGVYICDGCVTICNEILENAPRNPSQERPRHPSWEDMTDEQMLAYIPRFVSAGSQLEESLQNWVGQLRERGVTWQRIGSALGMTRQSAWGRFSGEE